MGKRTTNGKPPEDQTLLGPAKKGKGGGYPSKCSPLLALAVPSSSSWQESGSSEHCPLGHKVADRAEQEAAQLVPSPQETGTVVRLARQQAAVTVSLLKLTVFS